MRLHTTAIHVAIASLLALSGCASIFNGKTRAVTIQSLPEGANVSAVNRAGEKIHTGTAPVTLTLNRGAGYFKSEAYTPTFVKEGFASRELTLTGSVSGCRAADLVHQMSAKPGSFSDCRFCDNGITGA